MERNVGYIFVGLVGKFFWGSILVLSGMYLAKNRVVQMREVTDGRYQPEIDLRVLW
ncbi:hypothetical protein VCRA2123O444_70144 [Vibrio crassostreae]|nr:hypothetical protein VCRA2114O422_70144 [Vibrio crassostreae]CAK2190662.1 hypothetical protein VCRA2119O431_70145 [Vibrio crassostreae]CAK2194341.1 hypothetical protein VCRA2119O430_80001 [Vibrio crassostreae]CAK2213001.1 hypothetical protein VCRA2113O416_90001 [Vibrio crassostreae]CAK2224647.1 hypothetical protein VCRA2117O428_90145 [Vibrio crassostreae]